MMERSVNLLQKLKNSSLFNDSFWALLGNVVGKGLALIASIFIARLIGKEEFGMYSLIRTSLLSVAVFSTFGLGYTATKFIAEYKEKDTDKILSVIKSTLSITLLTGGVFTILLFIFSKQIAIFFEAPELYKSFRYMAIIVFFNSIITTQASILAGLKRFKSLARINFINGVLLFFSSLILTYYFGLEGALIALLISTVINTILNFFESSTSIRKLGLKKYMPHSNIKKELVSFSLPIAIQEMVYTILTWTTPILLLKFSDVGEVGVYNAAQQWSSVILFIPGTLRNVILAHVSSYNTNPDRQINTLNYMMLVNFLATFIPFLFIYFFSSKIVSFYGESFLSLKTVLNISVFSTIFICLSNVYKQYFMAVNKVWVTLWFRLGNFVFIIFVFFYFMKNSEDANASLQMAKASVIVHILTFMGLLIVYKIFRHKQRYGKQ